MATGNIAKNDITGRYIKTEPPTAKYTENFDDAFKKKPLRVWYLEEGIIIDADGDEYETLVGYSEFRTHFKNNQ